ncbi:FAD-dependent monooxygenase [Nocardia sp. CDC159]|uniref:FAD-dependent monooxygenase n=1 Tax=Nocardia pulmonis TaxID=2951408 RepID=A0A9X2EDT9_9NOCA|nr:MULTISPECIES: FAD-dependent oxidoreductase [Nocardia]MCM6776398.1 FAD-dependent monooxygenase [Nocardia pulmonis]MCM6788822.1 FAD-dependent monooxygenase [Nocardia sp. CDC159]
MRTKQRRAIVSGAGIAGLATALRLYRAGWDVLVVERASSRRSGGYLVNINGFGYDAAEKLCILPHLAAQDIGWFTTILVRADGSEKFTVPVEIARAAVGSRMVSVFRGDVETALYEQVSPLVPIRFGTVVEAVEQTPDVVRVRLSDGGDEYAELLIGADGLHSGVRRLVFGPDAGLRKDLRHMVGAFPLRRVPDGVPMLAGTTFIGPGRTAAVINVGPERSSAFFTYRTTDPAAELARGPIAALGGVFGDLGGGVRDALAQLAMDSGAAYFDSVSQIVTDRWSDGRIVLVGDAAWCVTPFAGYGVALALAGADRLGDALTRHGHDIAAALASWESALRPEVRKRQAAAHRGAARFAPATEFQVRMNELTMRAIGLPILRGAVGWAIARANR